VCGVNDSKSWFTPVLTIAAALSALLATGCPSAPFPSPPVDTTSDPTNGGATYIGSAACQTCHANFSASISVHGHSFILNETQGQPPVYASQAPLAGVAAPPPGLQWTDVDFVIGGYLKMANFVNHDGFLLTNPAANHPLQYNLEFPANGTPAGYEALGPFGTATYDFACFRCHTTGPVPVTDNGGRRQGNRLGVGGTWAENGVHCEACHGPGSRHVPDPQAGNIFFTGVTQVCIRCHAGFDNSTAQIEATPDGFMVGNQQASELAASPHTGFACTTCHDPHASTMFDPASIRNVCSNCHPDKDLALHEGKIFVEGNFVEPLACTSCHMPLASKYANAATAAYTGGNAGKVADTRSHIFRINPNELDFHSFFSPSGSVVQTDSSGQAALTIDFICLRCHNGRGSAFSLTVSSASEIAPGIHNTGTAH
jgi:hypothetical protein